MSSRPKILVTSASGKTGLPTVLQLREKGFPVRAFVRRLDQRSKALENAGAEIFVGNQYSLTDMRAAMNGVKRAYQCAPGAPNALHFNAIHCGGLRGAARTRRHAQPMAGERGPPITVHTLGLYQ
jgi:NAD(P)H dehydrogenase (quinone)